MSEKTFQTPLTCGDGLYGSIHQGNRLIAVAEGSTTIEQQDRARRIVLCVNYCTGEPDAALELFTAKEQIDLKVKYFEEASAYRDLCEELLRQLKCAADIDLPLIGSPTISELIDFWQHEKNEGRGIAQDMLDIYETITKAEKLLGEKNGTAN